MNQNFVYPIFQQTDNNEVTPFIRNIDDNDRGKYNSVNTQIDNNIYLDLYIVVIFQL